MGRRFSECHTGYRAYSRRFLETVPFLRNSNGFVFDTEVIFQAVHFGLPVVEVPISTRYFADASSVGFRAGVVYGLGTLATAGALPAAPLGHPLVREVPALTPPRVTAAGALLVGALVLLAVLDVVRAYRGTGLRPWQWAAGLLVVAALWRVAGRAGARPPRARAVGAAGPVPACPTYVDHARAPRPRRQHALLHVPALAAVRRRPRPSRTTTHLLGWPEAVGIPNVLPVGAPILWSPAHLLRSRPAAGGAAVRPGRAHRDGAAVPGDGRLRHARCTGRPASSC